MSLSRNRKSAIKISILLSLTFFLVVGVLSQPAGAQEKKPFKIGFIAPMSGYASSYGMDMEIGAKIALQELNYTIAGRKVEFIVEDDANNPANTTIKARKLVTHDKVDVVTGVCVASASYAIAPILEEAKIPFVNALSAADDLTQRKRSKNMIRLWLTSCQIGHPAGDYAYNELGWRKATTAGWEHSFGQEVLGSFQRVFEDAGGKVIQKIWTPLNTVDFAPYVGQLKRDADGLFSCVTAAPSMRFARALYASGLTRKWKHIGSISIGNPDFLAELKNAALGMLVVDAYFDTLDNPQNAKFRERVRQVAKREPNSSILSLYDAIRWIARAAEKVNGDTSDYDKWLDAIYSVELNDSPRGPMKVDKYGQIVENIYISEVRKIDGKYQNVVIHTYPMVSQFWKYDPEAYLRQPVYSRDNPPCRYCK